jgi:DNA-binding Xre family transcriptional regulator
MDMYRVKVRVKELCQEKDWSLNELSLRSGVTYSTVRRYAMQPLGKVNMDAICRIKEVLGCSWDELLEVQGDNSFDE